MSETPEADALIAEWVRGDLDIEDADEWEATGETISAKFLTEEGRVIFCFDLTAGYRPKGSEGTGLEEFDPYNVEVDQ